MTSQSSWIEIATNDTARSCRFCHRPFVAPRDKTKESKVGRSKLVSKNGAQFTPTDEHRLLCRPWAGFVAFNTAKPKAVPKQPAGKPQIGDDLVISDAARRILPVARDLGYSSESRRGKVYTERTRGAPSCSGTAALEARSLSMILEDDRSKSIDDDGDGDGDGDGDDSACDPRRKRTRHE